MHVRAGLTIALAAVAASGCGGAAGGDERAAGGAVVGEARIATNASAGELMRGSAPARGGVAEGQPTAPSRSPRVAVGTDVRRCSGGALEPTAENLGQIASATLCLLNIERGTRGRRPLRRNGRLAGAAAGHSRDMVRRLYFAHNSRAGATFVDRVRRTGYTSGLRGWLVGENLAWGGGSESTPRQIVAAWMQSPPHRANILQRRFREIGIGISLGAPVRSGPRAAATYSTNFGVRRAQ